MPIDSKPQIIKRVEALEGRYTEEGLNTETFPISDAVDSERSDIAASSKAVKTTYDAATRYATTTQQGQVILTHDVESGAQDRALTPFGAKTALDELEKSVTDRLDELEASLNGRIDQIISEVEGKFNELNIKIEGKLPLFDSAETISGRYIVTPSSGSLWYYSYTRTYHDKSDTDPSNHTSSTSYGTGFARAGEVLLDTRPGSRTYTEGTYRFWRIFP